MTQKNITIGELIKKEGTRVESLMGTPHTYLYIDEFEYEILGDDKGKEYHDLRDVLETGIFTVTLFDDEPDTVRVEGDESCYCTYYSLDCPVIDIFEDLMEQMKEDLNNQN